MFLSTVAFTVMAYRVPVVSPTISSNHLTLPNALIAKTPLPCHHYIHHPLRNHLILRHGHW
jgi:hypothetical protein